MRTVAFNLPDTEAVNKFGMKRATVDLAILQSLFYNDNLAKDVESTCKIGLDGTKTYESKNFESYANMDAVKILSDGFLVVKLFNVHGVPASISSFMANNPEADLVGFSNARGRVSHLRGNAINNGARHEPSRGGTGATPYKKVDEVRIIIFLRDGAKVQHTKLLHGADSLCYMRSCNANGDIGKNGAAGKLCLVAGFSKFACPVQTADTINGALEAGYAANNDEVTAKAVITTAVRRGGKWQLLARGPTDGKKKALAALKAGLALLSKTKGGYKLVVTNCLKLYTNIANAKEAYEQTIETVVKQSQIFVSVPLQFPPRLISPASIRMGLEASDTKVTFTGLTQSNAHWGGQHRFYVTFQNPEEIDTFMALPSKTQKEALFGSRGVIDKDEISIQRPNDARNPGSAATSIAGSVAGSDDDDPANRLDVDQLSALLGFPVINWREDDDATPPEHPTETTPAETPTWPSPPTDPTVVAPLSATNIAMNESLSVMMEKFRQEQTEAQKMQLAHVYSELEGVKVGLNTKLDELTVENTKLKSDNAELNEQLKQLKAKAEALSVNTVTSAHAFEVPVTNAPDYVTLATSATATGALDADAPTTDASVVNAPLVDTSNAPGKTNSPATGAIDADAPTTDASMTDAPPADTSNALGMTAPDTPVKRDAPASTSSSISSDSFADVNASSPSNFTGNNSGNVGGKAPKTKKGKKSKNQRN